METKIKLVASVIIPAHGRSALLERAVQSILNSNSSELAEIIIVDDASETPIVLNSLRECDQVIRLNKNSGAAVARNVGIQAAKGEIIYLMDSDDYFIDRDFVREYDAVGDETTLYYSNISSQLYKSDFPLEITTATFFSSIFFRYPNICQTSSLYFHRKANFRFDESLPKHQDWDFVLFSVLMQGKAVERGVGEVFFDRGDRGSLSRAYAPEKSKVWFNKLILAGKHELIILKSIEQVKFFLFGRYPKELGVLEFYSTSLKLLTFRMASIYEVLKRIYYRNF